MKLNVVTPTGAKFEDVQIRSVTLPGEIGEMQILPGHEALMAALKIGVMRVEDTDGNVSTAVISGGYVEVLGDEIHCLVETCETLEEIDLERAKKKLEKLKKKLESLESGTEEYQALLRSREKALLRVQMKETGKKL